VVPGVTVKEVHRQYVLLSDGGVIKKVELPEDAKSEGGVATPANRAPVPARTTSAPPPRVVVSPPPQPQPQVPPQTQQQNQSQPASPGTGTPQVPSTIAAPQTQSQTANSGNVGAPATSGTAPAVDMGSRSRGGYNPAGSQAAAPVPQAPAMPPAQPAVPGQAVPQAQPVPQMRTTPGTPAAQ
jgi:general secretion pathway protein C